jgi:hypothetical protein
MTMPDLIVSCDWSISPRKRWLAAAKLSAGASYEIAAPVQVDRIDDFFSTLRVSAPTGAILAGFDFPIGIPRHYAEKAGIEQFTAFLTQFGEGLWVDFYRVAETPDQISLTRPFYPRTPGGTNKQQLADGLGLESVSDLLRVCDHSTVTRRKACEIFWTLGASQVGRAAISGWRDLLAPAARDRRIAIWPFDGELSVLLDDGQIVAAEIYPREIYAHVGIARFRSDFSPGATGPGQFDSLVVRPQCRGRLG